MGLNDEIGSFSKRRDEEVRSKKEERYEDTYDEWDEDEYDEPEDEYDFKLYKLDELKAFNQEQRELNELISPWWKNLRTVFKKSTFSRIGMMEYKKKSLLLDDSFEDVCIENRDESLKELKVFEQNSKKSYWRRFALDIFLITFYILLGYWTGWSMIWNFLLGWSLFKVFKGYWQYSKDKKWFKKAETFIVSAEEHEEKNSSRIKEGSMEEVMAFNHFIDKEEREHWSVKLYDTIENLFTKKHATDENESLSNLDELLKSKMEEAEIAMKKSTVQTAIFILLTIAIYLMWGTPWYFWTSLVISGVLLGVTIFVKVMLAKSKKMLSTSNDLNILNI